MNKKDVMDDSTCKQDYSYEDSPSCDSSYNLVCEIERLSKELRTCRNELCLKCGKYPRDFMGACDGCRWYEK